MTLNSNANTNVPNATSMMSSYSSSTTNATRVTYDAMTENVNDTNASTMTMPNTNASKMESVSSMMANSTRLLPTNDTTVSMLASPTSAAAYSSVDTMTATKRNSADTTATKWKTAATKATKPRSAASKATKSRSAPTLKRKYDDSVDDLEYDDSDDDDDPPHPPKKRIHHPADSTFGIKKRIKAELLQLERMLPFKKVLLRTGGFVEMHWRQLYDQFDHDKEFVHELFFNVQNKNWRNKLLSAARDLVAPDRLGHISFLAARSALEIGKTAPFTSTILLDADDEANDVKTGNLVMTLEKFRDVMTTSYLHPMWRSALQRAIGTRHGSLLFSSTTVSWRIRVGAMHTGLQWSWLRK